MKIGYYVTLFIASAFVIGFFRYAETANNRYQSTAYNVNDTMNDIMNGIALGPNRGGQKAGNLDAVVVEFTFTGANVTYPVSHNLGRKPVGYILTFENDHGAIYGINESQWTASTIYLACNQAGTKARLLIF